MTSTETDPIPSRLSLKSAHLFQRMEITEGQVLNFWLPLVFADPMVKFVRDAMAKSGCSVSDNFFKPEECTMQVGGGFRQDDGVRSSY